MKGPREYRRLKTRSIELARQPSLNFFELSVLLAELADGPYVGLVEDLPNETGMSRRRLYYLLAAGRLIAEQGISKTQAEEVGWTKLQIIARHLKDSPTVTTAAELGSYLDLARKTNAHSLLRTLKEGRADGKSAVVFRLSPGIVGKLNDALLAFGATQDHRGFKGKEDALARILAAAMKSKG